MVHRPRSVAALSWLFIAAGTVGLLYHATAFRAGDDRVDVGLVLLVRGMAIVGGVFALRGANWSRWLLAAWGAFQVIISLGSPASLAAHTVLLIVVANVYFRGSASAWFVR